MLYFTFSHELHLHSFGFNFRLAALPLSTCGKYRFLITAVLLYSLYVGFLKMVNLCLGQERTTYSCTPDKDI